MEIIPDPIMQIYDMGSIQCLYRDSLHRETSILVYNTATEAYYWESMPAI